MSYYNRYRNKRRQDNNNNNGNGNGNNLMGKNGSDLSNNGGLQVPDAIFDLGKNKRVTVRQFRNINLIDIREYYQDSATGELRPGKKGISLTEDLYDELLKHRLNIDEALRRFGSRRPRTKLVRLLSDDEYDDDDDDKKDNNNGGDEDKKKKNTTEENEKKKNERNKDDSKAKRERDYSDSEGKDTKKRKPAAATLLPHEESIENAKREANATLVIPGMGKQQQQIKKEAEVKKQDPVPQLAAAVEKPKAKTETVAAATTAKPTNGDESSDEEFAESLQAEMDKMMDESSEEE